LAFRHPRDNGVRNALGVVFHLRHACLLGSICGTLSIDITNQK
jgi:hypothetical protein